MTSQPNSPRDNDHRSPPNQLPSDQLATLSLDIKRWSAKLGFNHTGITDINLSEHESHLTNWLNKNRHGEMYYMAQHGYKRSRPNELIPGTVRVISVRLDYAPKDIADAEAVLEKPNIGYISRYALGRDYHKVLRKKLQKLAHRIEARIGPFGYRVFTDSAPVLEKALAEKAGLGWIGKHSNLIDKKTGSWFFLGEIYVDIPLKTDNSSTNHCGSCTQCIEVCPTRAIVAPYQVDARRCISYLTIELKSAIPTEFRSAIGNRIYGCDDCQLVCPWNKFAQTSKEPDFLPRKDITDQSLSKIFTWTEEEFLRKMEGSPIRRIGHEAWQRNVAVALGNASDSATAITALQSRRDTSSAMVKEHIDWAINQHATAKQS